mgnify:FL=1
MHPEKNWKYYLGLSLFGYSFVPILTVELLFFLPLSHAQAASMALIYVGSGEVAFFAAIALLGRSFVETLKAKFKAFFIRNKPAQPPRPIGKTRHTVGVILFFASFFPYPFVVAALIFLHPTGRDLNYLVAALLAGDGIFITSLFVLGGEFWERLKRLFEWPGNQQAA